ISWNMHVKSPVAGGKGRDTAVALISSSEGIRWSSRMDHAPEAGAIQPGEILEMESGRVELTLSQGVTLQIDGRSRWAIEAGNRATLHLGRMVAKVPPQAVGFTVDTPTARVVDLGTEFEVVVNDAGNSSIHVMQGEVLAVQHN